MWSRIPFVRIMIPYVMGILVAGKWEGISVGVWGAAGVCFMVAWLTMGRLTPGLAWRLAPLRGVFIAGCIFIAGGLTLIGKRCGQIASDLTNSAEIIATGWICTLEESPQRKKNSYRATASIEIISNDRRTHPGGKGLIYFSADSTSPALCIGDRILTHLRPEPLNGPEFPGGFDAAAYFQRQGIRYRIFLKPGDWALVDSHHAPKLDVALEYIRTSVIRILSTHIQDREALGLAEALLIGYRNDLDERVSDAYSETGVVHVIAISGLHVGVIYSLLIGLLHLLIRRRNMRWMATLFALMGIWGFGMLAGGSPSVMRSVCMFSVIGIGKQLTGREGQGLNTLGAVACMMLAAQPWWLWDLGFQLSFTAVAGLMICYQPILGVLTIRNPMALKVWEMTAVTLSAQILTTPLLLHTFGRFPVFFLITNLVAIPLSTLILLGELGICILAPLHHDMARWCGGIVTSMIRGMNDYIFRMESIPFGTLEHIQVSGGEMMLIYLAITCILGWRVIKSPKWLMAAMVCLALTGTIHAWIKHTRMKQKVMVVMPLTRTRLLMMIEGTTARWLLTAFGLQDQRQIRMTMRAAGHHFGIDRHIIDTFPANRQFKLNWKGLNVMLLSRGGMVDSAAMNAADIILLSGNGPPKVEQIMTSAKAPIWIADGTNRLWKILQWETAAERLPLRLISTRRSGAFVHRIH
jgi:competence protein ComEC